MQNGRNEYQVWAPASSIFRGVVEDAFAAASCSRRTNRLPAARWSSSPGSRCRSAIDAQLQKSMSFDTITELFARELNGELIDPNGRTYQFGFTRPTAPTRAPWR
jgi:hypothetical protein